MAYESGDPFAEPLYAHGSGSFGRAGFDIQTTRIPTASGALSALAGGTIDITIADIIAGTAAALKGVPLVLIAAGAVYRSTAENNNVLFGVLKGSSIRQPRDLVGKTIGVATLISIGALSLRDWLPQHGVDFSSVKLVEVTQPAVVAMMQRGVIDAAFIGEPILSAYKNDLRDIGHPMDAIAKEFLYSAWYAMKDWVEADRPRARRAVAAIYDTARWANTHQAESLAIFVREFNFEPERYRSMIRSEWATNLTPQLIQPLLNICTRAKIFDRQVDANSIIATI
jgi:NitT/TauT family transport system substrate-binding protein